MDRSTSEPGEVLDRFPKSDGGVRNVYRFLEARSFYTTLLEMSVDESTRAGLSEAHAYLGKDVNQRK